jgi:hypothetical protein
MEFPITRKRLRNYFDDEAIEINVKQRVCEEVKQICTNVEKIATTRGGTMYVHGIRDDVKYGIFNTMNNVTGKKGLGPHASYPGILKEVLDALKILFPDSDIVTDPLETYIIIDWS